MQVVPTQPVANQVLTVQLDNQNTQLKIRQTRYGMFMDVLVNNQPIINGVICQNLNRIVRDLYLGFLGDFVWLDSQGNSDPDYTGLGGRFNLIYISAQELPTGIG
jgi:hypothetical protein